MARPQCDTPFVRLSITSFSLGSINSGQFTSCSPIYSNNHSIINNLWHNHHILILRTNISSLEWSQSSPILLLVSWIAFCWNKCLSQMGWKHPISCKLSKDIPIAEISGNLIHGLVKTLEKPKKSKMMKNENTSIYISIYIYTIH
jgi:hypothetical protein